MASARELSRCGSEVEPTSACQPHLHQQQQAGPMPVHRPEVTSARRRLTRQAGSRHRRIRDVRAKQCQKRASLPGRLPRSPRPRNRHAPDESRDETSWSMPLAECAGAARRLTAASTLARLAWVRDGTCWRRAGSVMLTNRIYAAGQSVPVACPTQERRALKWYLESCGV